MNEDEYLDSYWENQYDSFWDEQDADDGDVDYGDGDDYDGDDFPLSLEYPDEDLEDLDPPF